MLPPGWALRFLQWFCREDCLEEIEGDLREIFDKASLLSPVVARRKFIWGVLRHFRPEFIRAPRFRQAINPTDMLRHNTLITYRTFLRYKSSFVINLAGLSAGLVCAILIFLWVADELAVDKFHEKDAQLYQVFQGESRLVEVTPGLLASTLAEEMPEVAYATAVIPSYWFSSKGIISTGDNRFKVAPQFASKDFFHVFTYPLLEGNKSQVLVDKHAVVLSESLARRLFNTATGVTGKVVQWNLLGETSGEFFVTGVFKDVPANASTRFDILFNYALFFDEHPNLQHWGNSDPCTYVVLHEGVDVGAFNAKIAGLKQRKASNEEKGTFIARQYSANYLYGQYQLGNGGQNGGRIQYVRLFTVIAIFIVLIACINFMNLSTARASRRLKEIGIKKAIGAGRWALIYQYLGEAMLMTLIAGVISVTVVYLLLPAFNDVTAKHLSLAFTPRLVLMLAGIVVFTGLFSGSYPALYLSRFNPAVVLKGRMMTSFGELWARKGLVIVQFTASVVLIVCVLVVYRQITFIQSKNLGYNRDHVIFFEPEWKGEGSQQALLTEIRKIPGVTGVSCFYHNLMGDHGEVSGITWEGKDPDLDFNYANLEVGYDFIETLGIGMAAGQTFSHAIDNEKQIIFNEEAIRQMGIKDPVGKVIKLWGKEREIVGVAKDFNFESLYEDIKPCLFRVYPELPNTLVRIEAGSEQTVLPQLERVFRQLNPGLPFDYNFLDASYAALYASEQRVGILSRYFAAVAILISCLGLFGLATFTAERRVKEIGIRKILGATHFGIVRLLSAEFTVMVLIAIAIALPASYFICHSWLTSFAYRAALPLWLFACAGIITLLIAWLTVGVQTLRAARANPAETLKSE